MKGKGVRPSFLTSPNKIRCLAKEASTDRSSFEANTGLTFKEAASSIDDGRSDSCFKRKRSLTTSGLIEEVFAQSWIVPSVRENHAPNLE